MTNKLDIAVNRLNCDLNSLKLSNDFPFEFKFCDKEKNVIYLYISLDDKQYPGIDQQYLKCTVKLQFTDNYPFSCPLINFVTPIKHREIVANSLIIKEWSPLHGPKSLFCNIYCVYLEYIDNLTKNNQNI